MKYARLNDDGAIVEHREFGDQPADVPHKGVRWRRVIEGAEPAGFDPLLHTMNAETVFDEEAQCVRIVKTMADIPIEPERDHAIGVVRRIYRDRIVDALPDMGEVERLAGERDRDIGMIQSLTDLRSIRRAAGANTDI